MTDIRSEKWLWIKGVLFVVIGILSFALLLLELSNAKQVLLLLVSVWAFCRAYYFAFFVIEKYIDSNFRFAGLIYLPQYVAQRRRGAVDASPHHTSSAPLAWYVFWPCMFVAFNLIEPSLYVWMYDGYADRGQYTSVTVAGGIAAQIAFFALITSFSSFPLKITFPMSVALLWTLTAIFFFGCWLTPGPQDTSLAESVAAAILITPLLLTIATVLLKIAKSLTGLRWYNANEVTENCSIGREHNQISIRYLIATTVVVAASCLAIKKSNGAFSVLTEYEFLAFTLTVLVGSLPIIWLLILLVGWILSPLSWEKRSKSLALIAVGMSIFPFVVHRMAQFLFASQNPTWRSITMDVMLQLYCFIGGFMTTMSLVLFHARSQGFRVEYRTIRDITSNED